eukprot:1095129-Rhodomonas_salina.2
MTESKDPAPVAVRDTVAERVPGSEGEQKSPTKDQAERKPSKFLQKMRGEASDDVEISSQGELHYHSAAVNRKPDNDETVGRSRERGQVQHGGHAGCGREYLVYAQGVIPSVVCRLRFCNVRG